MFRCTIPEGSEVRLSADLIRPLVIGKKIKIAYSTPNSRYGDSKNGTEDLGVHYSSLCLQGRDVWINSIGTKGKFMYWKLALDEFTDTPGWVMFSTFGMSGQWSPFKGKYPCFIFEFTDGSQMVFNDPRHFGTIKFNHISELLKKLNELGWDPLSTNLPEKLSWIAFQLSKTNKSIAESLMNQTIFSGVGNYVRAEALYLSQLSPWRQSNKLSNDEIERLCKSIVKVMNDSYQHQGATIHTYKTAYGEEGKYSTLFQVYGKRIDSMGRKIVKQQTPDKRTIHWCPEVQV